MYNKNNSYEKEEENITSNPDKDYVKGKEELSSQMNKTLSPKRSIVRIILAFLAFMLWILIGVSPTIIFTSSLQGFVGVISFLIRNPIIFLLIAFLNIILAITSYLLFQILWWSVFHLLWSIRWFYGYGKYHRVIIDSNK